MEVESQVTGVDFEIVATAFDASFLSVCPDGVGRVFLGGREALFVVERDANGLFQAPKELFRFPPDSWLNDVAVRGDDLYVMTNAALYLLPEARIRRSGLECRRLIWGIPLDLHLSFHSLAWGPDGDLYFSAGDPYLTASAFRDVPDHWGFWALYGPQGETLLEHVGSGGVFRCRPDGTRLRQVAGGLRGPFGLTFDPQWNLFVCDNDHEVQADRFSPARILSVAPGVDFGWPRGWTQENTPRRSDLPSTVTESLGPGVPVGMAYHDGCAITGGAPALLLSRWESGVEYVPLGGEKRTAIPVHRWLKTIQPTRPLCLAVDVEGAVLLTLCKMTANTDSPHYPSEIRRYVASPGSVAAPLDVVRTGTAELIAALEATSFSRRLAAHQELIRRGADETSALIERWRNAPVESPARLHLPWIIAAWKLPQAAEVAAECCGHSRNDLRVQGLRIAEEFVDLPIDADLIRDAAADESESVQVAGLRTGSSRNLWKLADWIEFARQARSLDVLQHIGRMMADQLDAAQLAIAFDDDSSQVRLAATLAVGRRMVTPSPQEARRLKQPYSGSNCLHKIPLVDATVDLEALGGVGVLTTSDLWRAAASEPDRRKCFELLCRRLEDRDDRVRYQAAYYVELLDDHYAQPLVRRTWLNADAELLAGRPSEPVNDVVVDTIDGMRRIRFRRISPIAQTVELATEPPVKAQLTVNDEASASHDDKWYAYFEPGVNDVTLKSHDLTKVDELRITLRMQRTAHIGSLPALDSAANNTAVPPDEAASIEWLNGLSDRELQRQVTEASAEEGRRLIGRDGAGCVRCHQIVEGGRSLGAPTLQKAGARMALRQLAESIVAPSKAIAPQFRRSTLVVDDGRILRGLVVAERDTDVELLSEDGRRISLEKGRIEQRVVDEVSPMPSGLVRTRQNLMNMLNYLSGNSPVPP